LPDWSDVAFDFGFTGNSIKKQYQKVNLAAPTHL
jgi:hypothetical protein